jgi:hypothetical protein
MMCDLRVESVEVAIASSVHKRERRMKEGANRCEAKCLEIHDK